MTICNNFDEAEWYELDPDNCENEKCGAIYSVIRKKEDGRWLVQDYRRFRYCPYCGTKLGRLFK